MKASQITAGYTALTGQLVNVRDSRGRYVHVRRTDGMASQNGTLELFSKKVVALVGKHTVLARREGLNPILMFVLSAFISV